jgi:hypothetical protein
MYDLLCVNSKLRVIYRATEYTYVISSKRVCHIGRHWFNIIIATAINYMTVTMRNSNPGPIPVILIDDCCRHAIISVRILATTTSSHIPHDSSQISTYHLQLYDTLPHQLAQSCKITEITDIR